MMEEVLEKWTRGDGGEVGCTAGAEVDALSLVRMGWLTTAATEGARLVMTTMYEYTVRCVFEVEIGLVMIICRKGCWKRFACGGWVGKEERETSR
jgi:hypothetical protein